MMEVVAMQSKQPCSRVESAGEEGAGKEARQVGGRGDVGWWLGRWIGGGGMLVEGGGC